MPLTGSTWRQYSRPRSAASCTFFACQPFWRPSEFGPGGPRCPGISEVLHAEFHEHAYPPHTHDTWKVFVVDDGADPVRPRPAPSRRRRLDGRRASASRRSRRATGHESRLPQARALPRDEPAEREPGRPRGRRAVHRGHPATSSSGRSARATSSSRRGTRGGVPPRVRGRTPEGAPRGSSRRGRSRRRERARGTTARTPRQRTSSRS